MGWNCGCQWGPAEMKQRDPRPHMYRITRARIFVDSNDAIWWRTIVGHIACSDSRAWSFPSVCGAHRKFDQLEQCNRSGRHYFKVTIAFPARVPILVAIWFAAVIYCVINCSRSDVRPIIIFHRLYNLINVPDWRSPYLASDFAFPFLYSYSSSVNPNAYLIAHSAPHLNNESRNRLQIGLRFAVSMVKREGNAMAIAANSTTVSTFNSISFCVVLLLCVVASCCHIFIYSCYRQQ
jgi:hypothetical protein